MIDSLLLAFKNHKQARISVLKSSGRNRESIEEMALNIERKLKEKSNSLYKYIIIGFTIIIRRTSGEKLKKKNNSLISPKNID